MVGLSIALFSPPPLDYTLGICFTSGTFHCVIFMVKCGSSDTYADDVIGNASDWSLYVIDEVGTSEADDRYIPMTCPIQYIYKLLGQSKAEYSLSIWTHSVL